MATMGDIQTVRRASDNEIDQKPGRLVGVIFGALDVEQRALHEGTTLNTCRTGEPPTPTNTDFAFLGDTEAIQAGEPRTILHVERPQRD